MIKFMFLIIATVSFSAFAEQTHKDETAYTHKHKPCKCDEPIIFDETPLEKIFELKGKVYKILKGDDTNPSILYVLDPQTDKFIRTKQ